MAVTPWRAALGVEVRRGRTERGWTLQRVAARSGVPAKTCQRLEAGEHVNDWALIDVAAALGWSQGECFRILAEALNDAGQRRG